MFSRSICRVMLRDLASLRAEIESYPDEQSIWALSSGISNSAGTLALHLCGNLQHYVGAQLGATGYVRDRAAEFSRRDVPRAELLEQIAAAATAVETTMPVDAATLERTFPEEIGGHVVATRDFLVHLTTHLAYHLGQVDYHRRITTGIDSPLPRMAIAPLRSERS